MVLLTALIAFSKESMFLALLLFWGCQTAIETGRRRQALAMMAATVGLIGLSVLHSRTAASPWVNAMSDPTDPYHISLDPKSLWETYWFYLGQAVNKYSLCLIAVAVAVAATTQARWREGLMFVAMGLSLYVPIAMLPNHKLHYYVYLFAPLGFLPLILVDLDRIETALGRWFPSPRVGRAAGFVVILFLSGLTLGNVLRGNQASYQVMGWYADQERINHRLIHSLPVVTRLLDHPSQVLVVGLKYPFHPFGSERYVDQYFGRGMTHRWTLVDHVGTHIQLKKNLRSVSRWVESRSDQVVRWVDPRTDRVDYRDYDLILLYGPDGRLLRSARRAELLPIQALTSRISLEALDSPIFYDINVALSDRALADWRLLYEAGLALRDRVRDPGLAEDFLRRSATLAGDASPLPHHALGVLYEAKGRPDEAAVAYARAKQCHGATSDLPGANAPERVGLGKQDATDPPSLPR